MSRRTVEPASDGHGPSGAQKNQPRRVRRPTGAECRIQRLRRATGSDEGNLAAAARDPSRRLPVAKLAHERQFSTVAAAEREHPFARVGWPADGRRLRPRRRARARAARLRAAAASRLRSPARSSVALATGEHLVAEAGTGVGKSLAYLLPALESGQRVVVATATKALQEQLLRQGRARSPPRALGRELDVAVLKGRQNYLCRRQLQGFQPFLLAEGRDGRAWEAMQGWLDETETGDRAELELEPSEALWAELAVGGDRCAGRRCPFVSTCFAEAARERAGEADLVIANHALYFAHLAAGRRRAARARRGRLRRGAPARGVGRIVARRPRLARRAPAARARRRARLPRGAEAVARARSSTGSSARASGCCAPSRRRRAAGGCGRCPPRRRSCSSTRSATSPTRCTARARISTRSRGARSASPRRSRRASSRATLERVVWSEPDALAWAPVDVAGRAARAALGGRPDGGARLGDADDRRGRRLRAAPARARPTRARRSSARRTTSPSRRSSTCREAMPDPRSDELHRARRRGDRLAARALRRARARAHVELPRARRVPRPGARPRSVRRARAGRGAARAAARALPRRGRLGAARHVDVLAGRRRARRVAVAARDRQAAVLGAGRPVARGALRGGRARRRRLVHATTRCRPRCCSCARASAA